MKRWAMRAVSAAAVADPLLGDKLHRATLHTAGARAELVDRRAEWESLRHRAREIRLAALDRHAALLDRFCSTMRDRGAHVTVASSAADAASHVAKLVLQTGGPVTKSKSMTSEEVRLNDVLGALGVEVTETDLGELIVQLACQRPSHVTAPAIHLSVEDIAKIFRARIGMSVPAWVDGGGQVDPAERLALAQRLSLQARAWLRERFVRARVGISGANFLVTESGTIVLVENEANIQLTTCLPPRHIVLAGIDKLIESDEQLGVLLQVLPTSATGQRQSCYVSLFADAHPDLHVVLLDNGRSRLMQDAEQRDLLTCIRCGACLNACPVYRNVGGHAYGGAYPGPIGAALLPHLGGLDRYADLPFASSLCGACTEVCPVGIPLHERLLELRDRVVRSGLAEHPSSMVRVSAEFVCHATAMEAAARAFRVAEPWMHRVPGAERWTGSRAMPPAPERTFRSWWRSRTSQERSGRCTATAGATGALGCQSAESPATPSRPAPHPPRSNPPADAPASLQALVERFSDRFHALGPAGETKLVRFATRDEAVSHVRARMAQVAPGDVLRMGDEPEPRPYALGLSTAQALIADTGGIVLDFPNRSANRVASFVDTHLVVASTSQMVPDVPSVIELRTKCRRDKLWHDFQVLITGPSRTADVEKVLVIPAHGAREIELVLCDQPVAVSDL